MSSVSNLMPIYYSVIQYVPNPVIDEKINAGVIVFSGAEVRVHFVTDWRRVKAFGNRDITFFKEFAQDIRNSLKTRNRTPLLKSSDVDEAALREMASRWKNSIQFTKPRGSLLSAEALLKDVRSRFLPGDREAATKIIRRRTYIKNRAVKALSSALVRHGGESARELLYEDAPISGAAEEHRFSMSLATSRPWMAANAFSFEGPDNERLDKDVSTVAWSFRDVRDNYPEISLAMVVLPGNGDSATFRRAKKICANLRADLIRNDEVRAWADDAAIFALSHRS